MKSRILLLALIAMIISSFANAQTIQAHGGFVADSMKIGERNIFYLSVHYPSEHTILFPDSLYNFAPFEYQGKRYFSTKTSNGKSVDSAVYYLTTFEIDPVQKLSLPAFVVNQNDCTAVNSDEGSVRIIQLVHPKDSVEAKQLAIKENTAYENVLMGMNYTLILIIAGSILFLAAVALLIFGKRIRRYYKTKRLLKNHQKFQHAYNASLQQLQSVFSVALLESSLVLWKRYMEQLDMKPYTKLTTREMIALEKNETLGKDLKAIDGAIYGHGTTAVQPLESLKNYAEQRFQQKLKDLRHAK